jgi:hypothetical protein
MHVDRRLLITIAREKLTTASVSSAERFPSGRIPGYLDRKAGVVASLLLCKDHLDQLWCMAPCRSAGAITELVYDHVTDEWANYIRSVKGSNRIA